MSRLQQRCVVLTLKSSPASSINGAGLSIARMAGKTEVEIAKLSIDEETEACIGDVFGVSIQENADRVLVFRGDMTRFYYVAAGHDAGVVEIDGDAGDHLGGATDGSRNGMTGGRVLVRGNVGDRAGYRMRRGEILVAGNAGDFLAAHMVAGTIGVAGNVGQHLGYAMRRGSLLLANEPTLPSNRFSERLPTSAGWLNLVGPVGERKIDNLLKVMVSGECRSRRGDAAVAGQGEVVWSV